MTLSHSFRLAAVMMGGLVLPVAAQDMSRGEYVATTADCAACHTNGHDGAPYAGGYAIQSPMGAITSSNITPSVEFGIGGYSLAEFTAALRDGIRKDGAHLYPAMPYPSYARMTDDDIAALYDYLMTEVEPVEEAAPQTRLSFPFSQRWSMIAWNAAFARAEPFQPDDKQTPEWNRGRYLVEGPAHCGTCHTPRNLLMGSDQAEFLAGGEVGGWHAPNLTPTGLGDWLDQDLADYLKTGVATHARASGPMAEAVEYSLQHLKDDDIAAMVTYLRSLPAKGREPAAPADASTPAAFVPADHADARSQHRLDGDASGAQLYEAVCASCHGLSGQGSPDGTYPALRGNLTLTQAQGTNLLSTILQGVNRETGDHHTLMPGFGPDSLVQKLDDEQIARLASFTATSFGPQPVGFTADDVKTARTGGPVPTLVRLATPQIMTAGLIAALALLGLVVLLIVRRRRAA